MNAPGMIKIRLPTQTVIRPGPRFEPAQIVERAGFSICVGGVNDTIAVPPGEAFEIEREEGLRLIARFGGQIVEEPSP